MAPAFWAFEDKRAVAPINEGNVASNRNTVGDWLAGVGRDTDAVIHHNHVARDAGGGEARAEVRTPGRIGRGRIGRPTCNLHKVVAPAKPEIHLHAGIEAVGWRGEVGVAESAAVLGLGVDRITARTAGNEILFLEVARGLGEAVHIQLVVN